MPPADDILSPADVADIRSIIEDTLYADSYEVLRPTSVVDSGGYSDTVVVASTGNCRLRPLGDSALETAVAERLSWQVAYSIDLPYAADVTPRDRIRVNGSRTFEVGGVVKGGDWGFKATAVCREVG